MKKILLILMFISSALLVRAQSETVVEIEEKRGPYITNRLFDNIFISAAGGVQVYFGESDTHGSFGKRISPALDVSIGKWLTPCTGIRLQYSGLQARGWTYGKQIYSTSIDDKYYYKEKFNTLNLHADFLWNISNAIGGYREDRFWNFIPYAGFGWARSWSTDDSDNYKNEIAGTFGLLNNLNITPAIGINLEAKFMVVNQRFDYTCDGKKFEGMGTLTLGLTYKFNQRGFKRVSDVMVIEDNSGYINEISELQKKLNAANNANAKLKQALEKGSTPKVQVVKETNVMIPDMAIFFQINKANLTEKDIINIGYIADVINNTENKTFTIYASADKETGTPEYNQMLSEKRGEAVYKVLTEKYGVSPSRLKIHAVGSSEQKFPGAPLNRVVIIEDPTN